MHFTNAFFRRRASFFLSSLVLGCLIFILAHFLLFSSFFLSFFLPYFIFILLSSSPHPICVILRKRLCIDSTTFGKEYESIVELITFFCFSPSHCVWTYLTFIFQHPLTDTQRISMSFCFSPSSLRLCLILSSFVYIYGRYLFIRTFQR